MIFDATVAGRTLRVEVRPREDGRFTVTLDGRALDVDYQPAGGDFASLLVDGRSYEAGLERLEHGYRVVLTEDTLDVELLDAARGAVVSKKGQSGIAKVSAPMPGKIVKLLVETGQLVAAGQGLLVMEAMKMENEIRSPREGRVREVRVAERQAVETGALLVVVD